MSEENSKSIFKIRRSEKKGILFDVGEKEGVGEWWGGISEGEELRS